MLLRIGKTTLNMDQLLTVQEYAPEDNRPQWFEEGLIFRLLFGHPSDVSDGMEHEVKLSGTDAEAFAVWLDDNATNLTPTSQEDIECEDPALRDAAVAALMAIRGEIPPSVAEFALERALEKAGGPS